jgi:ATP-dependent exoDNAse (exonuclease V) beta subunit
LIKGSNREKIDKNKIKNNITHLKSGLEYKGKTDIEFLKTEKKEDEPLLILQKINKIVDNPDYSIREFDGENYSERKVKYKDIAVLSRTRTFGLKLQNLALKYNIPLNYDGGVELFKTEPSILVLAWLKLILNKEKISAWIPILEKEGYNYQEIKIILQNKEKRPKKILSFREELLKEKKEINNIIARILDFYNFNNTFSNALISEISNTLNSSLMSLSDLIYFIEQNIESAQTYNININNSDDAVTVETIHAAKGLEYPVVFIVDCNNSRFPSKNIGEPILFYDEILGLRSKKHKARKNNYNYIFNNLATDLLLTNLHSDFDEERRLLYVAITRAKQYVIFTANKNSSLFFEEMSDNFEVKEQNINEIKRKTIHKKKINDPITIKEYRKIRNIVSPHYFMNLKPSAQGPERGKRLHIIAERIAKNKQVKDSENTRKLKDFIDSFKGILKPELKFYLPFNNYLIRGQIDLVVFEQNKIIIVDYKTDKNNINQKEYQKQLSFYYAALKKIYPEKDIKCILFYIPQNKQVEIEPIELSNIIKQ